MDKQQRSSDCVLEEVSPTTCVVLQRNSFKRYKLKSQLLFIDNYMIIQT